MQVKSKNATKIYLDGKQYSINTALSRLLVMIQAEIKLFVISLPSVKHVILETLVSHYLMLAMGYVMEAIAVHPRQYLEFYDFKFSKLTLLGVL